MHYLLYTLNASLMIFMPLVLGLLIVRHRRASWRLFAIGGATFVLSQVGHLPFNQVMIQGTGLIPTDVTNQSQLIALALFLGLSAGLFEEVARYLTYRFWAKDARSWGRGLMLGAGHGGVEAMLLGLLVAVNMFFLFAFRAGYFMAFIPAEQLPLVEEQLTLLFAVPWYDTLLGAVERLFALCAHLSLSLMVMQVFVRRRFIWLAAAVVWHTLLNAVAVFALYTWNPYVVEGLLAVFAIFSLLIIFWLREPEPIEPLPEPLPPPGAPYFSDPEATADQLEESRYR